MPIDERDLVEEFSRSGGRGGQNVQKVETRVVLRHVPTGIRVVAQEERTREANRLRARERLVEALVLRERRARMRAEAERSRERSRWWWRGVRCRSKRCICGRRKWRCWNGIVHLWLIYDLCWWRWWREAHINWVCRVWRYGRRRSRRQRNWSNRNGWNC